MSEVSPERKKSCHEFIKKLRKEFNIKKDEFRSKQPSDIKSANLPVFDLSPSKKEKKKRNKAKKRERYKLAKWYLFDYLKPEYKDQVFDYFDNDLDQIVDWACEQVDIYLTQLSYDPKEKREMTLEEWSAEYYAKKAEENERRKNLTSGIDLENAPGTPILYIDPDGDIPGIYWNAYELYCDDHPIKTKKQAKKRKAKFIKMVNKMYMKTYGNVAKGKIKKGRWNTVDYMSLCVDKERMIENLKRLSKENIARTEQYKKDMEKFFVRIHASAETRERMLSRSKEINKGLRKRIDQMVIDIEQTTDDDVFRSIAERAAVYGSG